MVDQEYQIVVEKKTKWLKMTDADKLRYYLKSGWLMIIGKCELHFDPHLYGGLLLKRLSGGSDVDKKKCQKEIKALVDHCDSLFKGCIPRLD
jgi:hypothetical protein